LLYYSSIVKATDGYSFGAIETLCRKACRLSLNEYIKVHTKAALARLTYRTLPMVEHRHFKTAFALVGCGVDKDNYQKLCEFADAKLCRTADMATSAPDSSQVPLNVADRFERKLSSTHVSTSDWERQTEFIANWAARESDYVNGRLSKEGAKRHLQQTSDYLRLKNMRHFSVQSMSDALVDLSTIPQ